MTPSNTTNPRYKKFKPSTYEQYLAHLYLATKNPNDWDSLAKAFVFEFNLMPDPENPLGITFLPAEELYAYFNWWLSNVFQIQEFNYKRNQITHSLRLRKALVSSTLLIVNHKHELDSLKLTPEILKEFRCPIFIKAKSKLYIAKLKKKIDLVCQQILDPNYPDNWKEYANKQRNLKL